METIAHLSSEHWWVSLLYFAPVLVAVAAIATSAWRTRGGQGAAPTTTNEHEAQEDSDDA